MILPLSIPICAYLLLLLEGVECFSNDKSQHATNLDQNLNKKVQSTKKYNIVCNYASWSAKCKDHGQCKPEGLDPFLCTHLIYAYARIDNYGRILSRDPEIDLSPAQGIGGFAMFKNLKEINSMLKTLIRIGPSRESFAKFSAITNDPQKKGVFIASTVNFLQKFHFDGVDLDWVS